jgi:ribosomal protein S18 acetylase RimI-like enzyme
MSAPLRDLSRPAVVNAIEASLFAQFVNWSGWPRAELHDDGALLRLMSAVPSGLFNVVFRADLAHLPPDERAATIGATVGRFAARNLPLSWMVGPSARPDNLGALLQAQGLTHNSNALGMAIGLSGMEDAQSRPADLTITRVGNAASLRRFVGAMGRGFGAARPINDAFFDLFGNLGLGAGQPWRHYVGSLGDVPVASASLLLAAGVGGIYNVATAPGARRRGIGTALVGHALREASEAGYGVGVLHASVEGAGLYRRIGFEGYCTIGWYGRRAPVVTER